MLKAAVKAAEVVADLEDDKVPADEHVVELVRVDLEQDRGHSSGESSGAKTSYKHLIFSCAHCWR